MDGPFFFQIIRNSSSFFIPNSLESKEVSKTSSSLKFLLVKFVSRESREKSFAGKRSCPPLPNPFLFAVLAQKWPRLKRFTASFGSDTSLPPFLVTLSPPVMQISRRKLKFREVTLPSRLRVKQSRVPFFRFIIRKKKKRGKTFVFRNNFVRISLIYSR